MERIDPESAIVAGGWDARYAVTLAVATCGDVAAALVDANGDGADINLDQYRMMAPGGGWEAGASASAGEEGVSWSSDMVAAHGRTAPGRAVQLEYDGETHTVTAGSSGWWLFITPSVDEHTMVRVVEA